MTASGWHRKTQRTPAELERRRRYNSPEHRAARAAGVIAVASGRAHCWRCQRWIPPSTPWHIGHSDDGTRIEGLEHVRCNLGAAATKGARITNATRMDTLTGRTGQPRRRTRNW